PRGSSKTCPLCSGSMASYEDRSMKCKSCGLMMNRDIVAVLNLQMWGSGFTPKALYEPSKGKNYVSLSKTT
ncbi:transposase, partial [Candidatus Bathyarchaeota archaeon]|nr:transposase [Candidatus Bathyarchaeota archaeon]